MSRTIRSVYQNALAQNLEGMTGYLAWGIVCYLTLSSQPADTPAGQLKLLIIVGCLLLFIVGFYFTTRDKPFVKADSSCRLLAFAGQVLAILLIRMLTNSGVVAILAVAVAAQLPIRFSRLTAYFGVLMLTAMDYLFNAFYWQIEDALVWSSLSGAFNLFAFRMSQRVMQEQEARDEISTLNRELIATQALLQESTKQSERLRISRDLHDGLGHHLTALILKLQYLTYTTEGETKTNVTEAHDLAKQLLADVRETVHEMREQSSIGLKDAIVALISQIPRLEVTVDIDDEIQIPDARTADTLFRCVQEAITNTLKHGNASRMHIHLQQMPNDFHLTLTDNGRCREDIQEGNGLKGMRERIERLKGQLSISTQDGFGLLIRIPNMEAL